MVLRLGLIGVVLIIRLLLQVHIQRSLVSITFLIVCLMVLLIVVQLLLSMKKLTKFKAQIYQTHVFGGMSKIIEKSNLRTLI